MARDDELYLLFNAPALADGMSLALAGAQTDPAVVAAERPGAQQRTALARAAGQQVPAKVRALGREVSRRAEDALREALRRRPVTRQLLKSALRHLWNAVWNLPGGSAAQAATVAAHEADMEVVVAELRSDPVLARLFPGKALGDYLMYQSFLLVGRPDVAARVPVRIDPNHLLPNQRTAFVWHDGHPGLIKSGTIEEWERLTPLVHWVDRQLGGEHRGLVPMPEAEALVEIDEIESYILEMRKDRYLRFRLSQQRLADTMAVDIKTVRKRITDRLGPRGWDRVQAWLTGLPKRSLRPADLLPGRRLRDLPPL